MLWLAANACHSDIQIHSERLFARVCVLFNLRALHLLSHTKAMCTPLKCLTSPVSVFSDIFQPYTHYTLVFFLLPWFLMYKIVAFIIVGRRSVWLPGSGFTFFVNFLWSGELSSKREKFAHEPNNFRIFGISIGTQIAHTFGVIVDEQKNFELKFQNSVCFSECEKKNSNRNSSLFDSNVKEKWTKQIANVQCHFEFRGLF